MVKSRTSTVPADETKEQKSVRLAKARVPRALKALSGVANLGGSGYSLTEKQKEKIIGDIKAAVDRVVSVFKGIANTSGEYEL